MPSNFVVLVDTREQRPYEFRNLGAEVKRVALPAGDYSVEGFEGVIAVERKSLDDFAKTLIRDRSRFCEELKKLSSYPHACVVVEGNMRDVLFGQYDSGASPESVFGAAVSTHVDWGVPVVYCGDRIDARRFTLQFLRRAARRMEANAGTPAEYIR